jgi:hypothetical protein
MPCFKWKQTSSWARWVSKFFQSCWSFIKSDIVTLFEEFHGETLDIRKLDYGIITLLPKTKEASKIQQFSPTRIILKLVFEKAYDKVHWGFLMECMRMRGFHATWYDWVESVLQNGTMVVKLNGIVGPYFQSYKGVR